MTSPITVNFFCWDLKEVKSFRYLWRYTVYVKNTRNRGFWVKDPEGRLYRVMNAPSFMHETHKNTVNLTPEQYSNSKTKIHKFARVVCTVHCTDLQNGHSSRKYTRLGGILHSKSWSMIPATRKGFIFYRITCRKWLFGKIICYHKSHYGTHIV